MSMNKLRNFACLVLFSSMALSSCTESSYDSYTTESDPTYDVVYYVGDPGVSEYADVTIEYIGANGSHLSVSNPSYPWSITVTGQESPNEASLIVSFTKTDPFPADIQGSCIINKILAITILDEEGDEKSYQQIYSSSTAPAAMIESEIDRLVESPYTFSVEY